MLFVQTSGIQQNYDAPVQNYNEWTRAISINWVIYKNIYADIFNNDYNSSYNAVINNIIPAGFSVDKESLIYNSITFDELVNSGKNIVEVLKLFVQKFEDVDYVIGHNIQFHLNVVLSELCRNGFNYTKKHKTICLMKIGVDYCKIPSKTGYKFPTLKELSKSVLNDELVNNYAPQCLNIINNVYEKFYKYELINISGFEIAIKIKFLKLPIYSEGFQQGFNFEITKKTTDKIDVFLNGVLLYNDLDSLEYFDDNKIYLCEKEININGKNIIKRFVFDYRGLLIFEVYDEDVVIQPKKINIGTITAFSIFEYNKGICLNTFDVDLQVHEMSYSSCISVYKEDDKIKFIFLWKTKEIIFENTLNRLFFNKYKGLIYSTDSTQIRRYNFFGKFVDSYEINFEVIDIFKNSNFLIIKENNVLSLFDYDKKEKIISGFDKFIDFKDTFFLIKRGNKNVIIDNHSKIIYEDVEDYTFKIEKDLIIIDFTEDLILSADDIEILYLNWTGSDEECDLKKIINIEGEYITEGLFKEIRFLEDYVESNKKYSVYEISQNDKYDILIPGVKNEFKLEYDEVYFNIDTIRYYKNNLYGLLNLKNNSQIEPLYYDISLIFCRKTRFYELMIDEINSKIIDFEGNLILENTSYQNLYSDENNIYLTILENGKYNLFDLFSKQNIFTNFDEITRISRDKLMFCIKKDDKVKYVDFENNRETEYEYDDIIFINKIENRSEYIRNRKFNFERIKVLKNSKFGFLNNELEEVIECKYDFVKYFTYDEVAEDNEVENENRLIYADVCINNENYKIDINGNRLS